MFELRDGHIVVSAQAVLQAAQNLPFVLEGLRIEDVNFQGKEADRHFRSGAANAGLRGGAFGARKRYRQREAAHRQEVAQTFPGAPEQAVTLLRPDALCCRSAIRPWTIWRRRWKRRGLFDRKTLEYIANFHVGKIRYSDAALKSLTDFFHVILKAFERAHPAGINHGAFANHANLGIPFHNAIKHRAARDRAHALDAER